jgi:hypothetical protein
MPLGPRRGLCDRLLLTVFGLLSLAFGGLRTRLAVDVENRAMQSDKTPEAAVQAEREALFGRDSTLLFLVRPKGPDQEAQASAWLQSVSAVPGVSSVERLGMQAPRGGFFAALDLEAEEWNGRASFAPACERALAAAREARPPGAELRATGPVAGQIAIARALRKEENRVLPLLLCVLAGVLFVYYRSLTLVLAAFLPAVGSVLWLGGLQKLSGVALDPIATLLPPTLLTGGVAAAIHVIEGYLSKVEAGVDPLAAPAAAIRQLFLPNTLAWLMTVVGFLSLGFNALPAVRSFGVLASVGVTLSLAMTLVVLPPFLRLWSPRAKVRRGRTWSRIAGPLSRGLARRSGVFLFFWGLLGAVGLWGWTELRVSTDPLDVLPPSHPFRVDTEAIAAELGGIETFDLLLAPPHPKALPLALAGLASGLARLPGVAGPAGAPRQAEGTWLVPVLLAPGSSAEREVSFAATLARAHELGWPEARVAGLAVAVARDSQRLVHEQLTGLALSALGIGAILVLGLRSLRLGMLGMLPNLLACAVTYGVLALIGRPLTVATAMIGTVFLGFVVDDTVFYLCHFQDERKRGLGRVEALAATFHSAGRAITITSLALCAGFAACLSGTLSTSREFGALATAIVLVALGACLLLLPLLLLRSGGEPATP